MWTEDYLIGVEEIDEQHKGLLLTLGAVMEGLSSPENGGEFFKDKLEAAKGDLLEHFNTEEKYFRTIGFTEADRHSAMHKGFLDKATEYEIKLIKFDYDPAVVLELVEMLIEWFTHHIQNEDKKMADKAYWSDGQKTPSFQL